jgi:hypothetical protein
MAKCILLEKDEEIEIEAKEIDVKISDTVYNIVETCPFCGCRHFKYSLLVGRGIRRFCFLCNRMIEYRDKDNDI